MILKQESVFFALSLLQNLGGLVPDITLRGTKFINGNITVYQFTCATKFRFWGCTVEFLLNGGTYEDLRLYEKICYNRYSICTPDICSCSVGCNEFKWNVTADVLMENTSVECEGRIEADNRYYKANARLMLQRDGIITLGSTVASINSDSVSGKSSSTTSPALTNESNDIRQTLSTILSLAIIVVILLILIIVGMIASRCDLCKGLHIGNMQSFCCAPYKYLSKQIKKNRDNSDNPEELDCDSPKQEGRFNVKLGTGKKPHNLPRRTKSEQELRGTDYKVSGNRSYRKKNEKRIYGNHKRSTSCCTIGQNDIQRYNCGTGDESSVTDQPTGELPQSSRRRSHSFHLPEKENQEQKRRSPMSSDSGEYLILNGNVSKSNDDVSYSHMDVSIV